MFAFWREKKIKRRRIVSMRIWNIKKRLTILFLDLALFIKNCIIWASDEIISHSNSISRDYHTLEPIYTITKVNNFLLVILYNMKNNTNKKFVHLIFFNVFNTVSSKSQSFLYLILSSLIVELLFSVQIKSRWER